jgi:hypothetical protein
LTDSKYGIKAVRNKEEEIRNKDISGGLAG